MKLVIAEKPSVATVQNASIKYIKRDRSLELTAFILIVENV